MEAKDTVKNVFTPALEQAEISFKAGIREVVEWLPWEKTAYQTGEGSPIIQIQISEAEWEAQLKEWGVE